MSEASEQSFDYQQNLIDFLIISWKNLLYK